MKKNLIRTGIAAVAVLSLLAGWYFTLRPGVYVGDAFYYKVGESRYEHSRSDYMEKISAYDFLLVHGADREEVNLSADEHALTITFSDGTAVEGTWNGEDLMAEDGFPLFWDEIQVIMDEEPDQISKGAYVQALSRLWYGKEESISQWYLQALGLFVYLLGLVTLFHPGDAYFFLDRWRYRVPELSEAGIWMERLNGIIICVIGVLAMSGVILLFFN